MNIHKGEQYNIPFEISVGEETVTPSNADGVRIQIDGKLYEYPNGGLEYDSESNVWLYPLTQEQSSTIFTGHRKAQVAVRFGNDIVMSDIISVDVKDSIIMKRWSE